MLVLANTQLVIASDIKPCKLLVRPRPFDQEAAISYLIRISQANGFSTPRQLWRAMQNGGDPTSLNELMNRVGGRIGSEVLLFGPVPHYWKSPVLVMSGLGINDYNHHFMRWCPRCLAESQHLHNTWGLKLQCVCEKHGTPLTDSCPSCGALQRFERSNIGRCSCGKRLDHCDFGTAPTKVWAINRWLAHGSGADANFSNLSAADWHRLVRFLGQFTADSQPKRPGQISGLHHLEAASAVICHTAELLDDWPHQFYGLLAACQSKETERLSVRQSFGRLYRVLYRDLRAPVFQFLRDAFEDYLKENWWGFVCKRNRSFKSETVKNHPRLTLEKAARQAGTTMSVVRHLIQAELIPSLEEKLPSGRHLRSVHQNDVGRIFAFADGAMTLREAASFLALPERRVRELVMAGVLTPIVSRITSKAAAWQFHKEQLSALSDMAGAVQGKPELVSFHQILKAWSLRKGEFPAFVKVLMDGALRRAIATPGPIGRAMLDASLVRSWLQGYRVATNDWLSVDLAARVLGVKQQVAYQLVARGLLKTTPRPNNARAIDTAELQAFKNKYVSLVEVAAILGCSPRRALIDFQGSPVCGPSIDGARQYFFLRPDVF
jgi:hypothetical protein